MEPLCLYVEVFVLYIVTPFHVFVSILPIIAFDPHNQQFQVSVSVANGLDYASFQIMSWHPHGVSNVLSPTIQVTTRSQALQASKDTSNNDLPMQVQNASTILSQHDSMILHDDTQAHNLDCIIPGQAMAIICAFIMELLPLSPPRQCFICGINPLFNNIFCSPINLQQVTQEESQHTTLSLHELQQITFMVPTLNSLCCTNKEFDSSTQISVDTSKFTTS